VNPILDDRTTALFREALSALVSEKARFLVAGAFATNHWTGIWRNTKDLDVFCEPPWAGRILSILQATGFATHVEEKHWLGKAQRDGVLVDVIWGGGNWMTMIDQHWFAHAVRGNVVGIDVLIAPPQDIILSKAWAAGRERYDGADIVHLIRACGRDLDWEDLLARFGDHWMLLLQYLVLYRFVYPDQREVVPLELVQRLAARIGTDAEVADQLGFRGPLVDRYAYLHDLRYEGRDDPREEIARRGGYPVADVVRRRALDSEAFDSGWPYRGSHKGDEDPPADKTPEGATAASS